MKTSFALLLLPAFMLAAADPPPSHPLDPRGRVHIPIGLPNTVDALKTFVEAEGSFSPGFGSSGIYFWVWDEQAKKLYAPTMDSVQCEHGLGAGGLLIPWAKWRAGDVEVKTEVCQVRRDSPKGEVQIVGARVVLRNTGPSERKCSLFSIIRPLGPAGGDFTDITPGILEATGRVSRAGLTRSLSVSRHLALLASEDASGSSALSGPEESFPSGSDQQAGPPSLPRITESGSLSWPGKTMGQMLHQTVIEPGGSKTFHFLCPVLPGRRVVGHRWDGVSAWAQFDLNKPNPSEGGVLQPDPGFDFYRSLKVDDLFAQAAAYWSNLQQRVHIQLPDPRWAESFAAIIGHAALCLNEGAPDVAVVNYNVFNRDGMYVANIFQKSGNFDLAEQAIAYFLRHPFNGRVQPEADNPGQILWVLGEHWKFTRNREWLRRVYPAAQKIAAMIRYYRTTPGPHWVWDTSLDFGDALPKNQRKELKPGACDGFNPNYTEAYDIAGLRGAVTLAEAIGQREDAAAWKQLADDLFAIYERKFAAKLAQGYGSYSVLWPCRLYPFGEGPAFEQFQNVGAQKPTSWRYFPLAKAHQGLLAGNRAAGHETLNIHLAHPQMQGWYAFDEGGPSGVGGWHHARTTWPIERNKDGSPKSSVAMPHGWAIAEFQLLLRDALMFEDSERLVLFGGVPPEWFTHPTGMKVEKMPTHFGRCSFAYTPQPGAATLTLDCAAPGGYVLRLPAMLNAKVVVAGRPVPARPNGDVPLPTGAREVHFEFSPGH